MLDLSAKELRTLIHALNTELRCYQEKLETLDEEDDAYSDIANDLMESDALLGRLTDFYTEKYGQ